MDTSRAFVERMEALYNADLTDLSDDIWEDTESEMRLEEIKKSWLGMIQALLLAALCFIGSDMRSSLSKAEQNTDKIGTALTQHVNAPGHREMVISQAFTEKRLQQIEANQDTMIKLLDRTSTALTKLENRP